MDGLLGVAGMMKLLVMKWIIPVKIPCYISTSKIEYIINKNECAYLGFGSSNPHQPKN